MCFRKTNISKHKLFFGAESRISIFLDMESKNIWWMSRLHSEHAFSFYSYGGYGFVGLINCFVNLVLDLFVFCKHDKTFVILIKTCQEKVVGCTMTFFSVHARRNEIRSKSSSSIHFASLNWGNSVATFFVFFFAYKSNRIPLIFAKFSSLSSFRSCTTHVLL